MKRTPCFTGGFVALMFAMAPPAAAQAPIFVDNDKVDCPTAAFTTISAAVNAAPAAATILVCPGTYVNERVVLTAAKNNMQLIAFGAPGTVILDGTNPSATFRPPNHGFFLNGAGGVLILGFTLTRYFEEIRLTNAHYNTIRRNIMTQAGHDGITLGGSMDNLIEHNVVFDNLSGNACGINLLGASRDNVVRHNVVSNTNWGILVQGNSTGNIVFSNVATNNRSHGILNWGSSGTRIENKRVERNGTGGVSVLFPEGPRAGIGVQRNQAGGVLSNNVTVGHNRGVNNRDVDLFWDQQGAGNTFVSNRCVTSDPSTLRCEPPE
jgi:parallel beta-helix repeat protein